MATTQQENDVDMPSTSSSSEKRAYQEMAFDNALQQANRCLPHKKRRPMSLEGSDEGLVVSVDDLKTPKETPRVAIDTPSSRKRKTEDAWKHRLYPFDGPSIEEVTPLFSDIVIEELVENKLTELYDQRLASEIRAYYSKCG